MEMDIQIKTFYPKSQKEDGGCSSSYIIPDVIDPANFFSVSKNGVQFKFEKSTKLKDVPNFFGVENGHLQIEPGNQSVLYTNPDFLPTSGDFLIVKKSAFSFWSKFLFFKISVVIVSIYFIIQIIYKLKNE
ncbi:hypothetical protein ACTFIY_001266 [Dictyostelium cf. discoideum]